MEEEVIRSRKVTVEDLRNKIRSKKDLYSLLHDHYVEGSFNSTYKRSETFHEYAKTKPELLAFLPVYKSTQKPEREYLFDIIGNVKHEFLNGKIEEAHKKRLSGEVVNNFEKIEIREDILEELMSAKYESKTKGRAIYLLKKSSKLESLRRKRKPFQVEFGKIGDNEEAKHVPNPNRSKRMRRSNEL